MQRVSYGYARVSTDGQARLAARSRAEGWVVYRERRPSVLPCFGVLKKLEHSGTLSLWNLDRLGRSLRNLIAMVDSLRDRGLKARSITEAIDTGETGRGLDKKLL